MRSQQRDRMWRRVVLAAGVWSLASLSAVVVTAQEASVFSSGEAKPLPTVAPAPTPAPSPAPKPAAATATGDLPDLVPLESDEAIERVWRDMRHAYNKQSHFEVCQHLDTLRNLGQDITPSSATAGFAYLQCARRRAIQGELPTAEEFLKLSLRYGAESPAHDGVRAIIDRARGMEALSKGDLETSLRLLELANARGPDAAANEVVSAGLTRYAFEQHGRGDDVRALAALDAALLFYPHNRQADILRRDIWMWDYGAWIVVALLVFLVAIYAVFRQYREVKLRETVRRGF